jgi:hypothetical protein
MGNGFNDADRLGTRGWKGGSLAVLQKAPGTTLAQRAKAEELRVRNDVRERKQFAPTPNNVHCVPALQIDPEMAPLAHILDRVATRSPRAGLGVSKLAKPCMSAINLGHDIRSHSLLYCCVEKHFGELAT